MSDSDWEDPFAEDEAARERAARRAERERRRREESTRESLGERVRDGLAAEPAASEDPGAPAEPAEPEPEPAQEPAQPDRDEPATTIQPAAGETGDVVPRTAEHPVEPGETSDEPQIPAAPLGTPPPGRPPSRGAVARRRMAALVGLGLLIAAVAAAGAVLSRGGGDDPAPADDSKKARKTIELVVPEGLDRTQIADVAKKAGLEGDYEKATDSVKGFGLDRYGVPDGVSLEGFLFPATYEVYKGASVESLVKKQVQAFEDNFAETNVKAAERLGYDPYEVVIVASMVEREIAVPEERELAASVIYNRLDNGTPLGIDATIRFEDQNYTDQILQSRLESDTPYNTRTNTGLPPGPIANPGLASLQAAADPPDTDFFFFVVKPGTCNEHTFVETQEEFDVAAAEYQAALQAEGGSPTDC